ncbi:helix-turn-helix domain-containing protein [Methylotuvimicrobium sp. KM1]|uniref:helix-turn-helix domain-containing protein n=1 Tax=Methylotuvimicrobium sp. KM1 TaxID=3377707 RepID=UPI00384E93FA
MMKRQDLSHERLVLIETLNKYLNKSRSARFYYRLQILILAAAGLSYERIAQCFEISIRSIQRWVRFYRIFGLEGLKDDKKMGRLAVLRQDEKLKVRIDISHSPKELGYPDQKWSGGLLKSHLQENYGVNLSLRQCQRILKDYRDELNRKEPAP